MSDAGPYSIGSDHWPGISKLIEECGEVMQVAGKLIATNGEPDHWDGTNLVDRLAGELGDLLGAIHFVIAKNGLDEESVEAGSQAKRAKFGIWHEEQSGRRDA